VEEALIQTGHSLGQPAGSRHPSSDSAVAVLGDEILSAFARDLADTVRKNASIDWTTKKSVRAKLRVLVKRTLRKYGYPPDKQQRATDTVIQQAELLGEEWAG